MSLAEYINNLGIDGVQAEEQEDGSTEILFTDTSQNFSFNVFTSGEIYDYWQGFDIEEEVKYWLDAKYNGLQGVPYITDLVAEEELIDKTLEELAIKTSNYEEVTTCMK